MSKNPLRLKIAYLYPDILEGYCDEANVKTFAQRAIWRDISVSINKISTNEKFQSSKYDFYYIGGSNYSNLEIALKNLRENSDELKIAANAGVPILAVNCGYMLFGNFYQLHNKNQIEGLKILDIDSIAGKNQYQGNIFGNCEFLKNRIIAGYENHGVLTYLKSNTAPFLTLKKGKGNNGRDKTEGARLNNVIGTYIISPLLAQNPHLCDFLIAVSLRIKYKCRIPLTPLCDDIEWYSYDYIVDEK